MTWKCCVYGCNSNYDSGKKARIFRLPRMVKEREERDRWIKSIPRDNIKDNDNTRICEKHWPDGYETVTVNSKVRPKDPPSVFPGV